MGLAVKKPVRATREELYALARLKNSPLKTSTKYNGHWPTSFMDEKGNIVNASSTSQSNKKCA